MSDTTDEIVRAAVHWWESHRPLSFTVHDHVEHCTVNTCYDAEKNLARAVANAVRISLDAKSSHRNDLVNVPEGERP